MKREGRQHGMVWTYRILPSPLNPKPESRFIHRFDSPPTAGLFTKVSSKPTNHSKFTGKCGRPRCAECHVHPAYKSKEKGKGTQKQRSCDAVSNHKAISWRVVDGRPGFNFAGASATGILDHLSSDYYTDDGDYDDDRNDCICEVYEGSIEESSHLDERNFIESSGVDDDYSSTNVDYDEDWMRFCEVGFVLDQVDDWCLVEEMQ